MKHDNFTKPDDRDNVWEDLVVSILSVNQYSLTNTYSKIESLREMGIVNPKNLEKWKATEIVDFLRKGGCDRGEFMTNLFSERLASLGELISSRGIDICENILLSRDTKAITELLIPVNGIGPKVLKNFFFLRQLNS